MGPTPKKVAPTPQVVAPTFQVVAPTNSAKASLKPKAMVAPPTQVVYPKPKVNAKVQPKMESKVDSEKVPQVVPAKLPKVIPRQIQPQAAEWPLEKEWCTDYYNIKDSLQMQQPGRRMKPKEQWKYNEEGKLIEHSVWQQTSMGSRAKRSDKRAHLRDQYHQANMEEELAGDWEDEQEDEPWCGMEAEAEWGQNDWKQNEDSVVWYGGEWRQMGYQEYYQEEHGSSYKWAYHGEEEVQEVGRGEVMQ